MEPTNRKNNGTCVPTSSNSVVWDGPDIACISLCRGDKITDVVYKLATELCSLKNNLDVTKLNFEDFELGKCGLDSTIDFLQFLLDEIAKLKGDTNVSTSSALAEDPGSVVIKDTGWFKTIKNIYGEYANVISYEEFAQKTIAITTQNQKNVKTANESIASLSTLVEGINKQLETITNGTNSDLYEAQTNAIVVKGSKLTLDSFVARLETDYNTFKLNTGDTVETMALATQVTEDVTTTYPSTKSLIFKENDSISNMIYNLLLENQDLRKTVKYLIEKVGTRTIDVIIDSFSYNRASNKFVINGTINGMIGSYTITKAEVIISAIGSESVVKTFDASNNSFSINLTDINLPAEVTKFVNIKLTILDSNTGTDFIAESKIAYIDPYSNYPTLQLSSTDTQIVVGFNWTSGVQTKAITVYNTNNEIVQLSHITCNPGENEIVLSEFTVNTSYYVQLGDGVEQQISTQAYTCSLNTLTDISSVAGIGECSIATINTYLNRYE